MTQGRVAALLAFGELKGIFLESQQKRLDTHRVESQADLEYQLLRLMSRQSDVCPFQLGYELGEWLMADSRNLRHAEQIIKQRNIADSLLYAYQFIKDFFTFTRFEFSFSGYFINIRSEFFAPNDGERSEQSLFYLLLGRNAGMMCSINKASMFGNDLSIVSFKVNSPYVASIDRWAADLGCELVFNESSQMTTLDSRKLSLRHFLLNQVLDQLGKASDESEPTQVMNTEQTIPHQVLALFNEYGANELTKEQVASSLNLSTRTFGRRLQEQGTSWRRLLSEFRIDKAKQLLSTQALSLQQVADSVGFSSLSAFSSAFSKAEGISPSEFQRRMSVVEREA